MQPDRRSPLPLGGALLVLVPLDVGTLNLGGATGWVMVVSGVLVALLAWSFDRAARSRRKAFAVPLGAAAGLVSITATAVVSGLVSQRTPGTVEFLCLLLIIRTVCRRLPYWLLVPALALPVLATGALAARLVDGSSWALFANVDLWFAVLPIAAVLWGAHLRATDAARLAETERIRRDERLGLARDLHDDVAHHVTAMIVQAQAGEHVVAADPERGRTLFANIERTGQEGLAAMSRMVLLLRDGAEAAPAPVRPLEVVRECVDRFAANGTGVAAELRLADGVEPDSWPLDLTRSVERLVQEGLTNVRKHARTATSVVVAIEPDGDRLLVRVRDNGGRAGLARFRQSGFGLIGLSERVCALGGEVTGGPVDGGWQLTASIPRKATP